MQPVSSAYLSALRGSHTPWWRVDAWYDGQLVAPNLPLAPGGAVNLDASRMVQGQVTGLTFPDPDGLLEPLSETAPLAPYGSVLHVSTGIEGVGDVLSLGWYRITRTSTDSEFGWYDTQGIRVWVKRGGAVMVDADDRMWQVEAERFLAPESPSPGGTCVSEVKRLLYGVVPFGSSSGFTDRAVPTSVVYNDSRSDAVKALATACGSVLRVSPAGTVDMISPALTSPVWTIDVSTQDSPGVLVKASTELVADDLPNVARSTGTDPATQLPVTGIYGEPGGPLRFGGPHGRIPVFHDSPLIDSQATANADARSTLENAQASRSQTLAVTCLPNPALQLWDTVRLRVPSGSGTAEVDGQVLGLRFPLSQELMQVKVQVPRASYLTLWNPGGG